MLFFIKLTMVPFYPEVTSYGLFDHPRLQRLFASLDLTVVAMLKTMPIFSKLSMKDQVNIFMRYVYKLINKYRTRPLSYFIKHDIFLRPNFFSPKNLVSP